MVGGGYALLLLWLVDVQAELVRSVPQMKKELEGMLRDQIKYGTTNPPRTPFTRTSTMMPTMAVGQ